MDTTRLPRVSIAVAMAGACLIAMPPVSRPDIAQHGVQLVAADSVADLTSSLGSLLDVLDPVQSAAEMPDLDGLLAATVGIAEFDPIADLWDQIVNSTLGAIVGAVVVAVVAFGALVWAPVSGFLVDTYEWLASVFGFDPYPEDAMATPIDPGGVEALLGGWASNLDSGELFVPDVSIGPEMVDVGGLLSDLFPDLGI